MDNCGWCSQGKSEVLFVKQTILLDKGQQEEEKKRLSNHPAVEDIQIIEEKDRVVAEVLFDDRLLSSVELKKLV